MPFSQSLTTTLQIYPRQTCDPIKNNHENKQITLSRRFISIWNVVQNHLTIIYHLNTPKAIRWLLVSNVFTLTLIRDCKRFISSGKTEGIEKQKKIWFFLANKKVRLFEILALPCLFFQSQSVRLPRNSTQRKPTWLYGLLCSLDHAHYIEWPRLGNLHETQIRLAKSLYVEIKFFLNCSIWIGHIFFRYLAMETNTSAFFPGGTPFSLPQFQVIKKGILYLFLFFQIFISVDVKIKGTIIATSLSKTWTHPFQANLGRQTICPQKLNWP